MNWLRFRAGSVPSLAVDVSLALGLGVVGAAQLWSQQTPFKGDRYSDGGGRPGPGGGGDAGGGGEAAGGTAPFPNDPDTLTYLLLGLCAGSLVFRSRWPLLTLAGVTAFGAAYLETGQPVFVVQLIVLVAVYSAVADSGLPRATAIAVSLLCGGILTLAIWASDAPRTDAQWAMDAAWLLAPSSSATRYAAGERSRRKRSSTVRRKRAAASPKSEYRSRATCTMSWATTSR